MKLSPARTSSPRTKLATSAGTLVLLGCSVVLVASPGPAGAAAAATACPSGSREVSATAVAATGTLTGDPNLRLVFFPGNSSEPDTTSNIVNGTATQGVGITLTGLSTVLTDGSTGTGTKTSDTSDRYVSSEPTVHIVSATLTGCQAVATTTVASVAPQFIDGSQASPNATVKVASTTGVTYRVDGAGADVSGQSIPLAPGSPQITIVATANSGYELASGNASDTYGPYRNSYLAPTQTPTITAPPTSPATVRTTAPRTSLASTGRADTTFLLVGLGAVTLGAGVAFVGRRRRLH